VLEGAGVSGNEAEVTSALPLTDAEKKKVKEDVLKKLGTSAKVTFNVDPNILGGLILRVGDKVVDGSVVNQVQSLRESLR
jgi:F-type H+-transporting ATPase subunit b